jgi:hypothetical protein
MLLKQGLYLVLMCLAHFVALLPAGESQVENVACHYAWGYKLSSALITAAAAG